MMEPKPCVIFDLDGTLADCSHRLHYIQGGKRDWDTFFMACGEDIPIKHTVALFELISRANDSLVHCGRAPIALFIVTGRPERTRTETEGWLSGVAGIEEGEYEALLMRPSGDFRPDHVVKAKILANIRGQGYEPLFAVDDRPSVVKMWRKNGAPCFACDDANWHGEGSTAYGPDLEGKTLLTLMVGPTGAGKSAWLNHMHPLDSLLLDACQLPITYRIVPPHIISSDQLRHDLCGDWADQSKNREVFAAMHEIARARLKHGLPVVLDATHLRRRDRLNAAALAPAGTRVLYVVMNRRLEDKLRDMYPEMPEAVVHRHEQTFRSQLADILAGDGLPNVDVVDLREDGA